MLWGEIMNSYWNHYDEMHTLSWDIEHSACGSCPHVNNCLYYVGKCPNGGENDEYL